MALQSDATNTANFDLEQYRTELTGYCYRMLGSGFEAEDAVQETMIRAWRKIDTFEGRSALRSWLYRIATNVCLDMLQGPQRRARPMDLGPASAADSALGAPLHESAWVLPIQDGRVIPVEGDPAELAALRETIRLAFVAALQHLPPKQRAALILRDVLRWQASEVAELLDTSVQSVNSALQRARATIEAAELDAGGPVKVDEDQSELLARYLEYFESYDIDKLVALISEDASFTMPPFPLWLRGTTEIAKFYVGQGAGCEGSTLVPLQANGLPGFAAYKPAEDGTKRPWAIQLLEISGGKFVGLHHFLGPELFEAWDLPMQM